MTKVGRPQKEIRVTGGRVGVPGLTGRCRGARPRRVVSLRPQERAVGKETGPRTCRRLVPRVWTRESSVNRSRPTPRVGSGRGPERRREETSSGEDWTRSLDPTGEETRVLRRNRVPGEEGVMTHDGTHRLVDRVLKCQLFLRW